MMTIAVVICAKMLAYEDTFDMDSSSDTVIDLNIVFPKILWMNVSQLKGINLKETCNIFRRYKCILKQNKITLLYFM